MKPRLEILLQLLFPLLLVVGPAGGQLTKPDVPATSPLWWTLTDEITPAQLKAIHADVAAHRERFRAALEAGLDVEGYPGEVKDVRYYVSGAVSPELVPLWFAFDSYVANMTVIHDWDERMTHELLKFGIEGPAAAVINGISAEYFAEVEARTVTVKANHEELLEILDRAKGKIGEKAVDAMIQAHDHVGIAIAAGTEVNRTKHLVDGWGDAFVARTAVPYVVRLRDTLPPEEWSKFRQYLLLRIAIGIHAKARNSDL